MYARILSSITLHIDSDQNTSLTYTSTCVYILIMDAMKGLSSETLEAIILQVQEYRLLWDKAQGDYKDHDLKEVTWNKIGQSVDLSGLCQIICSYMAPCREKTCLRRFANNKGADQPAHLRSLISALIIRFAKYHIQT